MFNIFAQTLDHENERIFVRGVFFLSNSLTKGDKSLVRAIYSMIEDIGMHSHNVADQCHISFMRLILRSSLNLLKNVLH